jgi:hypothetical protein
VRRGEARVTKADKGGEAHIGLSFASEVGLFSSINRSLLPKADKGREKRCCLRLLI